MVCRYRIVLAQDKARLQRSLLIRRCNKPSVTCTVKVSHYYHSKAQDVGRFVSDDAKDQGPGRQTKPNRDVEQPWHLSSVKRAAVTAPDELELGATTPFLLPIN